MLHLARQVVKFLFPSVPALCRDPGVWFVVTVNGAFMYFDGQNFIVQMSSFFSLLAIATFAVDFIMVYVSFVNDSLQCADHSGAR